MDMDHQTDKVWVLGIQSKLYQWSKANPDDQWRDMWGWLTDLRVLRHAWHRVASNKGGRTAGIDGMTVGRIRNRSEYRFLVDLQADLRSGAYQPSPARRKLIPKAGKPGQFRPLGIPTIRDRVVQGAVKILLEPIFEAQFWHVSYGFRPGRNTHGALEYIRRAALPQKRDKDTRRNRLPYPWVIEGDIKGCFDNINHHHLLERMRKRIGDRRVVRLVGSFLKAGVLTEDQFLRTDAGTPQGGIISPLLANIALSAIEERYERWTYHRRKTQARRKSNGVAAAASARDSDRIAGRCVFLPVRYADDFVVLVSGSLEEAMAEKSALADYLIETTGLTLSPEKTKVTAMTEGFEFLGFRFSAHWDQRYGYGPRVEIPKAKAANLRHKVKQLTQRDSISVSLGEKLRKVNSITSGWANYYRYCVGAGRVFVALDWYIGLRLYCWLHKKRPKATASELWGSKQPSRRRATRRVWREGSIEQHVLGWTPVERYRLAWMEMPDFAMSSGEPDA
ncbi:group II intron reverse transcriptase/maturase [Sinorhizobium meliloti]|nr:group II intron reverse transcriptase/maturase [Sinorhizobium meliloti]MDW9751716.1 group II intron reverse transcriptase/maturase [Sinorhizobium meliloti]MDX0359908.1 group II intron reverse transcriptase/maturase [Sinorhizobium meliloti]QND34407.1 group II intron reverse transcriptase/maturase [Sinorhizobium meliloti]QND34411.1 group II intron reverse transcriptase/maturase [Sinorhizobium meliloti]